MDHGHSSHDLALKHSNLGAFEPNSEFSGSFFTVRRFLERPAFRYFRGTTLMPGNHWSLNTARSFHCVCISRYDVVADAPCRISATDVHRQPEPDMSLRAPSCSDSLSTEDSLGNGNGSHQYSGSQRKRRVLHLTRPRASKACTECHTRKVRCDLEDRKSRCTNCLQDGKVCEIQIGRRKKVKRKIPTG